MRLAKIAVFVDGCFLARLPASLEAPCPESGFVEEESQNARRDRDTNEALERMGWMVIRV